MGAIQVLQSWYSHGAEITVAFNYGCSVSLCIIVFVMLAIRMHSCGLAGKRQRIETAAAPGRTAAIPLDHQSAHAQHIAPATQRPRHHNVAIYDHRQGRSRVSIHTPQPTTHTDTGDWQSIRFRSVRIGSAQLPTHAVRRMRRTCAQLGRCGAADDEAPTESLAPSAHCAAPAAADRSAAPRRLTAASRLVSIRCRRSLPSRPVPSRPVRPAVRRPKSRPHHHLEGPVRQRRQRKQTNSNQQQVRTRQVHAQHGRERWQRQGQRSVTGGRRVGHGPSPAMQSNSNPACTLTL